MVNQHIKSKILNPVMAILEVIPASPMELSLRRRRLSGRRQVLNMLIRIKGIELQFKLSQNGGKANEATLELGQEIVLLKAKVLECEDGIILLDDMISWLNREEMFPQRLAS